MMEYLIFTVDNQEFGVSLDVVKRVIWAVYVTPISEASANLVGMVTIHNEVVPVLNLRNSLALNDKPIDITDQFIICQFSRSKAALWVDRVIEIIYVKAEEQEKSNSIFDVGDSMNAFIKREGKLVPVYDWEALLNASAKAQVIT